MCLFRPKERLRTGGSARVRGVLGAGGKLGRLWCQGRKGDSSVHSTGGRHGDGTNVLPFLVMALSSSRGVRKLALSSSLSELFRGPRLGCSDLSSSPFPSPGEPPSVYLLIKQGTWTGSTGLSYQDIRGGRVSFYGSKVE